jgi:D-arginine dehydrogenase
MTTYDFAVIGGGIAGASVAAKLAPYASVVLLEAEDVPGYHSTGRSAAFWHETLGGPLVQPLSKASLGPLRDGGFLTPRTSLNVAEAENVGKLDALEANFAGTGAQLRRLDYAGICGFVPRAKPILVGGVLEVDCADIDVGGLLNQYISDFRKASGTVVTDFRVDTMTCTEGRWTLSGSGKTVVARVIVNAAGAWADHVAALAGAKALGLQPMRRTIAQVRVDGDDVPHDLPLTIDIAGTFYFRPEGVNKLWLCPHDETPVEPGDASPEEIDVAIAIDRFETVTDWRVLAVEHKWAGLRTFAPDRLPVYGFDSAVAGFFWCAGQGGYGIQTAPAAAEMCAALLLDRVPDAAVAHIDPMPFSPYRFESGVR